MEVGDPSHDTYEPRHGADDQSREEGYHTDRGEDRRDHRYMDDPVRSHLGEVVRHGQEGKPYHGPQEQASELPPAPPPVGDRKDQGEPGPVEKDDSREVVRDPKQKGGSRQNRRRSEQPKSHRPLPCTWFGPVRHERHPPSLGIRMLSGSYVLPCSG